MSPTDMFNQTAYRNQCRTTILEPYKHAWRMLKEHEYSYRRVQRCCASCRLQEMFGDIKTGRPSYARWHGRAQTCFNIDGMNDHFMRSLRDRYEVIYDGPSPMAMIVRVEATIHAEKSCPLNPCRLSANEN